MSPASVTISEREFTEQIRELTKAMDWRRYHTWISTRSEAGFPDEVLVRQQRLVFAELKSERGKVSTEQAFWLEALARTGAEVYVWRPSMLEAILGLLAARFRPEPREEFGAWTA